ncbi:hypothetical protein B0O99DRAFT_606573 [Bisporella sp. PMI_857]|nr:hypothetical protein B0O99DRAFT_606573 [Bisporella sp. PMI_857]
MSRATRWIIEQNESRGVQYRRTAFQFLRLFEYLPSFGSIVGPAAAAEGEQNDPLECCTYVPAFQAIW